MRRHACGLIAIGFLMAAAVRAAQIGLAEVPESVATSILLRVGLVLGAIWLAYPQLQQLAQRVPPWLVACTAFGLVLLALQPKAFRLLLPVLAVVVVVKSVAWLFTPSPRTRPSPKAAASRQRRGE